METKNRCRQMKTTWPIFITFVRVRLSEQARWQTVGYCTHMSNLSSVFVRKIRNWIPGTITTLKMASMEPLKDIDETFCLCSICLEQFKEPKLLPCLHRFCKKCLSTLIEASRDTLRCPECREEINIPSNGEFKTDFYMKNLVEYIQIQRSLQSDEIRKCYGCLKHRRVTAYCFKCNDFLCEDCHNFHFTSNILKDHKKHTLSLEDTISKNITIEKLASMRDAPRCDTHPEKISELYCESCDYIPVCIACMFGKHKGHNLHEVKELAKSKREMLVQKLKSVEKLDEEYKLSTPKDMKKTLVSNVNSEKEKLIKLYTEWVHETKEKLSVVLAKQELIKKEKQTTEKEVLDLLQAEKEAEIQKVVTKYEEITKVKKKEISVVFHSRESFVEKEVTSLNYKLERFERDNNALLESIEMQLNKNMEDIDTSSKHFYNIKKRVENLRALCSSIISSENDWTAVQCIPDMSIAADNLIDDMNKEFPEWQTKANVTINYKQTSFRKSTICKISEDAEKTINIKKCHYVNGVRGCDGKIVITGCGSSGKEAFIITIDENGEVMKLKTIMGTERSPFHCCDFLPPYKVVTVLSVNKIVVYNMLDDSHMEKIIPSLIYSWPEVRGVACVAVNPLNNHILVGGNNSRDVYVFDDKLKYLHTLALPETINWPKDMTISNDCLLVCDFDGKKSYLTRIDGSNIKIFKEFIEPNFSKGKFSPWRVCTDKYGLIYMLWKNEGNSRCCLVQYNNDGSHILSNREIDKKSYAFETVETSQGDKLFIATHDTQTGYFYGLLDED